jgi:protein-L-isoaspartate(D-aspartate) O-methyltransferase
MSRHGCGTSSTENDDAYAARRGRMVERQLRRRGIDDERVLAAMASVPRERFLSSQERRNAYHDGALPIGGGQTMSQPWIVAYMASLLALRGDERVLEVGTGSGYGAAVLSLCCAEVITVERDAALAEAARTTLAELAYDRAEVRTGDGTLGAADRAPFGGIVVTAAAEGDPPRALIDQLAPGAALVCPVDRGRDERIVVERDGERYVGTEVRFVPLVEGEAG